MQLFLCTGRETNIIQYNEYYPFGLQTANSWTRENTTGNNFLGNGGTELNATSNLYDLEYRNYDPVLGRMNGVDPLATKYASVTPYNFSFNDPVSLNDPSGAEPLQAYGSRSPYHTFYTYDDKVDYYSRGEFYYGSSSAMNFHRNGMDLRYGGGGSGGWVAQFGNLRIDYNSLEDGLSYFGFSDGQVSNYFHGDQLMALAYGALYNDRHNSWSHTAYGSETASIVAYAFAKQNGGALPSRTQVNYWLTPSGPVGYYPQWTHTRILRKAFGGKIGSDIIDMLVKGSIAADEGQYQDAEHSHMHAMLDPKLLKEYKGNLVLATQRAKAKMENYTIEQGELFLQYANQGKFEDAYIALGMGMHPLMDMWSPEHSYWKVWDPSNFASKYIGGLWHFLRESVTPMGVPEAVLSVTEYYDYWVGKLSESKK